MLLGEFQHNMDLKGRVIIPSKFRDDLGEKFYVCRGLEGCLTVYSPTRMQEFEERISQQPIMQANKLKRYFFSGAAEVEPDKQGRILIPQNLREHAGLAKEVTVVGGGDKAEIWAADRWMEYQKNNQDEQSIEEMMNTLGV